MKIFLLSSFFIASSFAVAAQTNTPSLPSGKYEAFVKASKDKWTEGDIILLDGSRYKISSNNEIGEYKVSAAAQRIFFISGPLQTAFAKVKSGDRPAILLPAAENEQQGLKLPSDVVAYFRN